MPLITAHSPAMAELVDDGAELTRIADGCTFTEGPLWVAAEGAFYFSDMPADTRRRWTPAGGVEVVAHPSNKGNGMTLDLQGRVIVCEHVTSQVVRLEPDGSRTVLASHWDGKELNSPNDVVVTSDGSVWFTDPPYGRWPVFGEERDPELDFCGVYRIDPDGELHLAIRDFNKPNGLCFTDDERTLYINDTEEQHIRRFAVDADGSVSGGEVIYQIPGELDYAAGVPDGMKMDVRGNLWCTAKGGVHVVSPAGELLGVVNSEEVVGNLGWGDDWHTLFLCTSTTVHTLRTAVAGHRSAAFR